MSENTQKKSPMFWITFAIIDSVVLLGVGFVLYTFFGNPTKVSVQVPTKTSTKNNKTENQFKEKPRKELTIRVYNPKTTEDFTKIVTSPEKEEGLLDLVQKQHRYSNMALLKIRQLRLINVSPKLREIFEKEHRQDQPNVFFETQLLKTIWVLSKDLSKEEQERLKKAGVKLK